MSTKVGNLIFAAFLFVMAVGASCGFSHVANVMVSDFVRTNPEVCVGLSEWTGRIPAVVTRIGDEKTCLALEEEEVYQFEQEIELVLTRPDCIMFSSKIMMIREVYEASTYFGPPGPYSIVCGFEFQDIDEMLGS